MRPTFANQYECQISNHASIIKVFDYEQYDNQKLIYTGRATFLSLNSKLCANDFLDKEITLSITSRLTSSLKYVNGIVTQFISKGKIGNRRRYEIVLEPQISKMNQIRNGVINGHTIPEMIESYLKQANINNYRFDLYKEYNIKPFMCQYHETDLKFLNRYIECANLCYYYEQSPNGETIVFTDQYSSKLSYEDQSNLSHIPFILN
jgi:type VI secretion system secreted protein VgrG